MPRCFPGSSPVPALPAVLVAVLLTAGCATPLPQTPPAGESARIEAPTPGPDDQWRYRARDGYTGLPRADLELRVVGIAGDVVTLERTADARSDTERHTRDGAWLARALTNLQPLQFEPPLAALPFPLHAGQTWRQHVTATDPATGRRHRVRVDGRVLGWERVQVPAGTFDALKVERRIYAGNADYFRTEERIHEIDWYAPRAAAVVKSEASSEYTDTSRSCRYGLCTLIRNDYAVYELTGTRTGTRGVPQGFPSRK